jgi:ATP-dependent protease HslVU (ClpYQ) peptidase subunit
MVSMGIEKMRDKPAQAQKVIQKAVEIACAWDVYTSGPVMTKIQYGKRK